VRFWSSSARPHRASGQWSNDYDALSDGKVVGRIWKDRDRWFWWLFPEPSRPSASCEDRPAPTFEEAEAEFRAAWEASHDQ